MQPEINDKIEKVKTRLRELKAVVIGFSGGKDSFFLLKLALEALGRENVTAFFIKTIFSTQGDEQRVDFFASHYDFKLQRMFINISGNEKITNNPKDRCYHCKTKIFSTLVEEARGLGVHHVLDGSTYSDLNEYRPGRQAIQELHIISPLQEAGLLATEIVDILRNQWRIPEYFTTSSTCLATRFPYGVKLEESLLKAFDAIESLLLKLDVFPVKVRYIENGVRIETPDIHFPRILEKRSEIISLCRELGFKFITLDIEGIKSGAWD